MMTVDSLKETISEIANIPVDEIHEHSSFKDELSIDSMQMVNLILEISTRFGIQLNKIESNEDLATVGSLYKSLTRE